MPDSPPTVAQRDITRKILAALGYRVPDDIGPLLVNWQDNGGFRISLALPPGKLPAMR